MPIDKEIEDAIRRIVREELAASTKPAAPSEEPTLRLREWRVFRGMSLGDLADRSGMSASSIGKLERGKGEATQSQIVSLADALSTRPTKLFRLPEDRDRPGVIDFWDR